MEKQIYDEKNGLWYELQGDYYLPCLTLPEQEDVEIGVWGQRRRQFLRQNHRVLYYNLLTSGKLNSHLAQINQQAEEMFFRLVNEYADRQGVTEQLKTQNPLEWIGRMNDVQACVRKILVLELICT